MPVSRTPMGTELDLGLVMFAGLQDDDVVVRDVIDQAVRVVDAAGPRAGEDVLEGLGFADASERIAQCVGNQLVDSLESLTVLSLPVDVVLPPIRVEGDRSTQASKRSCCSNSPRRARSIAVSNRSALAGLRSRYAVSVIAS